MNDEIADEYENIPNTVEMDMKRVNHAPKTKDNLSPEQIVVINSKPDTKEVNRDPKTHTIKNKVQEKNHSDLTLNTFNLPGVKTDEPEDKIDKPQENTGLLGVVISDNSNFVAVRNSHTSWSIFTLSPEGKSIKMWEFKYDSTSKKWKITPKDDSNIANQKKESQNKESQNKGQKFESDTNSYSYFYFSSDSKLGAFIMHKTQKLSRKRSLQKYSINQKPKLRKKGTTDDPQEIQAPLVLNSYIEVHVIEFKGEKEPQSISNFIINERNSQYLYLPQLTTLIHTGKLLDGVSPDRNSKLSESYHLVVGYPSTDKIQYTHDDFSTPYNKIQMHYYSLNSNKITDDPKQSFKVEWPNSNNIQWAAFSSPYEFVTVSYISKKCYFYLHTLIPYYDEQKKVQIDLINSDKYETKHVDEPECVMPTKDGIYFQQKDALSKVMLVRRTMIDEVMTTVTEEVKLTDSDYKFNGDFRGRLMVNYANINHFKQNKSIARTMVHTSTMGPSVENSYSHLDIFCRNQKEYTKLYSFNITDKEVHKVKLTPDLKYLVLVSKSKVHFSYIEANQAYALQKTLVSYYAESKNKLHDSNHQSVFTKMIHSRTVVSEGAIIKQDFIYASGYLQEVTYAKDRTVKTHRVKYSKHHQIDNLVFSEYIDEQSIKKKQTDKSSIATPSEAHQQSLDKVNYSLYGSIKIEHQQLPCVILYVSRTIHEEACIIPYIMPTKTLQLTRPNSLNGRSNLKLKREDFLKFIWGYTGVTKKKFVIHPSTTRETLIFQNDHDLVVYKAQSSDVFGRFNTQNLGGSQNEVHFNKPVVLQIENFYPHIVDFDSRLHPLTLTPDQISIIAKVSYTPPKAAFEKINPKVITVLKSINIAKKTEDIICDLSTTSKINYSFVFSENLKHLIMTGYHKNRSYQNIDEAGYVRIIDLEELRVVYEFQTTQIDNILISHWIHNYLVQAGNTTGPQSLEIFFTDLTGIGSSNPDQDIVENTLINKLRVTVEEVLDKNKQIAVVKREILPNWVQLMTPMYMFQYKDLVRKLITVPERKIINIILQRIKLKEIISNKKIMTDLFNIANELPMFFECLQNELSSYYNSKAEYPIVNEEAFSEFVNGEKHYFNVNKSFSNFLILILMAPCNKFETCQLEDEERSTTTIIFESQNNPNRSETVRKYQRLQAQDRVEHRLDNSVKKLIKTNPTSYKYYQVCYSLVKLNLSNGSSFSKKLFHNLSYLPENDLRSSLKALIYFKWNEIFKYVATYSIIYWLTCICIYLFYYNPHIRWLGWISIVFMTLHILFELLCLIAHPKRHYFKKSNIFDTLTLGSNTLLLIYILSTDDYHSVALTWVECICLMAIWIRGVSWLRLFDNTRHLTSMLYQVFKNILPLLLIISLTVFLYGFVWRQTSYLSERDGETLDNYYKVFIEITNVTFGNSPEYDELPSLIRFIILVIANLVLALVLNNLLIAIINETYISINKNRDVHDVKEILEVITDFDSILYWKNKYITRKIERNKDKEQENMNSKDSQNSQETKNKFEFYCSLQEKDINNKTLAEIVQPFTENISRITESLKMINGKNNSLDTDWVTLNKKNMDNAYTKIDGELKFAVTTNNELTNSQNILDKLNKIKLEFNSMKQKLTSEIVTPK